MVAMTGREAQISADIKGWFAGCMAATAVLFLHGLFFALTGPKGLSLPLLLVGLLVAVYHFLFIALFTAIPAGVLIWGVRKAQLEFRELLFVAWGAALGWFGHYLFSPFDRDRFLYAIAGGIAGFAAWYCSRKPAAAPDETVLKQS